MVLEDGRNLAYADLGDPNGNPCLYFHGWPGGILEDETLHKKAKKHKIRLLMPVRPGNMGSDPKEGRTLLDWELDIREFSSQLGLTYFNVIGVSGGAPYALCIARQCPDCVQKVFIVSGLAPLKNQDGVLFKGRNPLSKLALEFGGTKPKLITNALKAVAKLQTPQVRFLAKALAKANTGTEDCYILDMRKVKETYLALNNKTGRVAIDHIISDARIYNTDWGFRLQDIQPKIHCFYGLKDRLTPMSMAQYFQQNLPHCQLYTYANEGHALIMNKADDLFARLAQD